MFVLWLSHSGKAIHRVYPTQAQEAFLEGHVEAIGGVLTRHIKYDNLTSAVAKVIQGPGRARAENDWWVLVRSHYGFDPFYCQPGIDGAHQKLGVESAVGWFRRNHLTPMPEVDSLEELNERIKGWEAADQAGRVTGHTHTIGGDFAAERPLLRPLPTEPFDPGMVLHPRVDRSAMITVRMVKYSVPAHLIGQRVRASQLVVFEGRTVVATQLRVAARTGHRVVLDYYLEVLRFKLGALPGSTALAQARAAGVFTPAHEAFSPPHARSTATRTAPASWSGIALDVVKLPDAKRGFVLLPRRWVVECSFAWATRFRRLAKDYERLPETAAGLHFAAFACLLLHRLLTVAVLCP